VSAVTTVEARSQFSEILNRAAYGRERVVLTRRGKPIAAVVSIDDLRALERLIDRIEDQIDREEAERLLSDPNSEFVSWEEVKRGLRTDAKL
jgi:prevent-host-death family protein